MTLRGEWECGLSEILFVKSWNNVTSYGGDKNYSNIHFSCSDCTFHIPGVKGPKFTYGVHVKIEVGYYDTPTMLVTHITEAIEKVFSKPIDTVEGGSVVMPRETWPSIVYYNTTGRVHIALREHQSVDLSPQLYKMLGFTQDQSSLFFNAGDKKVSIKAKLAVDLNADNHSLYVYCDVLESILVADTLAPLLRIVDTSGKTGTLVHRYYDKTIYVPLQKKNFDTLELDIRSDLGEPIQFTGGKVVAVLHFRQAKNAYYLP